MISAVFPLRLFDVQHSGHPVLSMQAKLFVIRSRFYIGAAWFGSRMAYLLHARATAILAKSLSSPQPFNAEMTTVVSSGGLASAV